MQPRVLILRAPGTNCDQETAYAFERAGGLAERVHINRLLESPTQLDAFQILCLPGGFCYGDDIAAGVILASQIRHRLADCIERFHQQDKLILGICNGFQVLMRTGVLLPHDERGALATLTGNDSGRFEDRWVRLGVVGSKSVFLRGIDQMLLPVAHAEGKFVARDAEVLRRLEAAGQLVLRYRAQQPGDAVCFPDNPNGSQGNVAGVCDATGRVLGLMPHPERHIDPLQHPRWTRGPLPAAGEGMKVFQNAIDYFR